VLFAAVACACDVPIDAGGERGITTTMEGEWSSGWTLLFYLAADNEQESYADATLKQLMTATAADGSHPQVVVLVDRLSSTGTEIFEVAGGQKVPIQSAPEQVTSSGAVLEQFATLGLARATGGQVAFVIKSEGLAWRGIGRDNTHAADSPDTLMPVGDLAGALTAAQTATGKSIDLLVLEGSIMAFIEVIHELRAAVPVLAASQSKIQPDGVPWARVIGDLDNASSMTSVELARAVADNHVESYADNGNKGAPAGSTSMDFASMTIFDMSQVPAVKEAHGVWAATTWALLDEIYNLLPHARDLSDVGGWGEITDCDYQSDIETFMTEGLRLIGEAGLSFPTLKAAVEAYLAAQDRLVLYHRKPSDGSKLKAANGLSIWYPPTWNQYDTRDASDEVFGSTMYYEDPTIGLDWVTDSNWTAYLIEYFDRGKASLSGSGADEPPKPGAHDPPGKGQ
jgi:hypothetical protein